MTEELADSDLAALFRGTMHDRSAPGRLWSYRARGEFVVEHRRAADTTPPVWNARITVWAWYPDAELEEIPNSARTVDVDGGAWAALSEDRLEVLGDARTLANRLRSPAAIEQHCRHDGLTSEVGP